MMVTEFLSTLGFKPSEADNALIVCKGASINDVTALGGKRGRAIVTNW